MQWTAGYPNVAFYTLLFLVAVAAWEGTGKKALLALGASLLFALALTSAQWLTFLEFFLHGERVYGTDHPYHLALGNYLELLRPSAGIFGTTDYTGVLHENLFNLHLGLVALAFWIGALVKPLVPRVRAWGLAALFILPWLAGKQGPFGWLLSQAPWNELAPSKAGFLFLFAALTAALGQAQAFSKGPGRWRGPLALGAALLLILEIFFMPGRVGQTMPNPYLNPGVIAAAQSIQREVGEGRFLRLQTKEDFTSATPRDLNGRALTQVETLVPNASGAFGIRSLASYSSLLPEGFLNLVRYGDKAYPYPGRLFDVAGVRLYLGRWPMPPPKYQALPAGEGWFLNLNRQALPTLRVVPGERLFDNRPLTLEAAALSSASVEKEVFLDKDAAGNPTVLSAALRSLSSTGHPGGIRLSPQQARWYGREAPGSYLVFNETFFPGWKAWVDGRPTPILRAYGQFMAVKMGSGKEERVEFRYEPATFRLGLFLSLAALGVLAALFLLNMFYLIERRRF